MIQYWFKVNCHFGIAWQNITLVKRWNSVVLKNVCLFPMSPRSPQRCPMTFTLIQSLPDYAWKLGSRETSTLWLCHIIWPGDFADKTGMGDVREAQEIEDQLSWSWRMPQAKQRVWRAFWSWQTSLTDGLTEIHLSVLQEERTILSTKMVTSFKVT